jgi:hypothetical protein
MAMSGPASKGFAENPQLTICDKVMQMDTGIFRLADLFIVLPKSFLMITTCRADFRTAKVKGAGSDAPALTNDHLEGAARAWRNRLQAQRAGVCRISDGLFN